MVAPKLLQDVAVDEQTIPEWDLGDRLRKALRHAGMEQQEMAAYLEVSKNSVGNWVNGKNRPSRATLQLWALRTGVSYGWLRDGAAGQLRKQLLAVAA